MFDICYPLRGGNSLLPRQHLPMVTVKVIPYLEKPSVNVKEHEGRPPGPVLDLIDLKQKVAITIDKVD